MEPAESPKPPAAEVRPMERQDIQRLTRDTVVRLDESLKHGALEQGELPANVQAAMQEALEDPAATQALRSFGLIPHLHPEMRWRNGEGLLLLIEGKEAARSQNAWPGDIVQMLRRGLVSAAMNREEETAQIALNRSQMQTETLGRLQTFDTLKEDQKQAAVVLRELAGTLGFKQDIDVLTVSRDGNAGTTLIVDTQTLAPLAYIELSPVRLIAGMSTTRPSVSASTLTLNPALSSLPQQALLRLLCARVQAEQKGASVERSSEGYVLTYKDVGGSSSTKTFRE